jgi:hypothetical protein
MQYILCDFFRKKHLSTLCSDFFASVLFSEWKARRYVQQFLTEPGST